MILLVNGVEATFAPGATVADILDAHQVPRRGVAVARNDAVVRASEYDSTVCSAGDRIEIIRAVAGG